MRLRSLLFVPGDRPDRMHKALQCGADALILDLEDSVAASRKALARDCVCEFLQSDDRHATTFVRINPLSGADAIADLTQVAPKQPAGIVQPKAAGGKSIAALDSLLSIFENRHGLPQGQIKILPIATETPAAIFQLGTYRDVTSRLIAMTWGAEDLPAAIGAATSREADGSYTPPYEVARSLLLFGAAAADVPAIETVFPAYSDLQGLAAYAARGRRDGFAGMMAIHPNQIAPINAAFSPTPEEVANAQAIVDAFNARPDAGTLSVSGRMVDRPHLVQARQLLSRAAPGETHD